MEKIREFFRNKWVKFSIVALLYLLIFVVWTGNPWPLIGLPIIYDIYISKYFYRRWGYKHTELRKRSKTYNSIMGWVDPILFAVIAATIIRLFFFEMYVIPTPSMEKSLLVGDYLCVSKVKYGPKVPNTPLSFPLVHHTMPLSQTKKSFVEWIKWPYHRLKGTGEIKRNDVVVFNFPEGDTVMLNDQQTNYYDIVRLYGREHARSQSELIYRPVDKRENYVKRCVAVPGDTIRVIGSQVYINGETQIEIPKREYVYFIRTNGTMLNPEVLENMGIAKSDIGYNANSGVYTLPLTDENLAKIKSFGNVTEVIKYESTEPNQLIFPHSENYAWTEDNFGPLWVPQKGATVKLTPENLPLYERIISIYEDNKLEVKDGKIYIDDKLADSYTFKMDYYFMMGDNRHNSADSRYWGFVPEDHVVGKASFVWLSLDKEKSFPSNIRWSRMFRSVK